MRENDENIYDEVDMRHKYNAGFWIGALSGVCSAILLIFIVGLWSNGWQLP